MFSKCFVLSINSCDDNLFFRILAQLSNFGCYFDKLVNNFVGRVCLISLCLAVGSNLDFYRYQSSPRRSPQSVAGTFEQSCSNKFILFLISGLARWLWKYGLQPVKIGSFESTFFPKSRRRSEIPRDFWWVWVLFPAGYGQWEMLMLSCPLPSLPLCYAFLCLLLGLLILRKALSSSSKMIFSSITYYNIFLYYCCQLCHH